MAYQISRNVTAKKRRQKKTAGGEGRSFTQLTVCGVLFSLLVVLKLILPQEMERLQVFFREKMESSIDVQAVFSSIGEAIGGEQSVGDTVEEVYAAVFNPVGEAVEVMEDEADIPAVEEEETPPAPHVYTAENIPEDAALEQEVLGFAYCAPVMGTVSSPFGYREHPVEGVEKFHYGLDIAAAEGTEICAFADGTVQVCGESSSLGKYLILAHENDYTTLYAHCSSLSVTSGETVAKGQKIAEVGRTGTATGDHLHFELRCGDTYIDPIYYASPH